MSRQQMPQQQQQQMPQSTQAPRSSMIQNGGRVAQTGSGASYYPTPAFQNHIEQLEQEYEQDGMIDEPEIETPAGHGHTPQATMERTNSL